MYLERKKKSNTRTHTQKKNNKTKTQILLVSISPKNEFDFFFFCLSKYQNVFVSMPVVDTVQQSMATIRQQTIVSTTDSKHVKDI